MDTGSIIFIIVFFILFILLVIFIFKRQRNRSKRQSKNAEVEDDYKYLFYKEDFSDGYTESVDDTSNNH
jgi:cbb3-type cytochrome oxidase subunit 3